MQYDRPDVARCEAVIGEIARQHDFIEFIDHVRVTFGHGGIFFYRPVYSASNLTSIRPPACAFATAVATAVVF